jgi:hypothetical protein
MKNYIVTSDSIGFAGGVAKRGEVVTEDQIGAENASRLIEASCLTPVAEPTPETPGPVLAATVATPASSEPTDLKARLSVGLGPVDGHEFSEEEEAWIQDVFEEVEPVPFNTDAVLELTAKEIASRIGRLTGTDGDHKTKKSDLAETLRAAVVSWFESQRED